jgi:hypothetical protein
MFTDIVAPNIFHCRNDWNVKSFNCKQYKSHDRHSLIIANEIEKETGIHPFCHTGNRKREYRQSRQLFAKFMKKYTNYSLLRIGKYIDKDHTTVLHSINIVNNYCDTDKEFRELYCNIDEKINLKLNRFNK